MAIGWLALLKGVPWAGVISTAPLVVDGAKQLWNAVSKKPAVSPPPPSQSVSPHAKASSEIEALDAKVVALESAVTDLHAQMLKSSELIKVLADQNAQLIARVESHRLKMRWMTALAVVALMIALFSLAAALAR
jgi:hypothetical protein